MDPRWGQSGGAFRRKQQLNWVLKDAWEIARQTEKMGKPCRGRVLACFPTILCPHHPAWDDK